MSIGFGFAHPVSVTSMIVAKITALHGEKDPHVIGGIVGGGLGAGIGAAIRAAAGTAIGYSNEKGV
jgi:hypothetical protein